MATLYQPGQTPPRAMGGVVLLWGVENVGKSTMVIKSDDVANPLFYNNFDRDAAHLLKTRTAPYWYEGYRASNRTDATAQLTKFDQMVTRAVTGEVDKATGTRGVFGIDNGEAFWGIVKLAKLPEFDDDPPPKAYDEANAYVDDALLRLEQNGLWVVVTSPGKEIWTRERAGSGEWEAKGWNRMKNHIIVEAVMFLNTKQRGTVPVPIAQTFKYTYNAYIRTSKKRPIVEGTVVVDPSLRKILETTKEIAKREEKTNG